MEKGQLNLSGLVLAVGTFAIILVIVFSIMSSLSNSPSISGGVEISLDSNQFSPVNGTSFYYADYDSRGFAITGCSDLTIYRVE